MSALFQFINDSGFVGWCIIFVGIAVVALIIERCYALYLKFGMDSEALMTKVQTLILSRRSDEALVSVSQLTDKPLARAFKTILEKADRDDDSIFQAHDIAMAENVPLYTKRLHYLSMLSNVATLLGLLGTIHGLILSFQAVAQADPSTKQAMLANGIAVSMYTTALGLGVAIPAMVAFAFLVSRQNTLVEQLTEKCGKLTELLTGSHLSSFTRGQVFPDSLKKDSLPKPPPSSARVS
jgi:biopolymer transport protein ExbB